MVLAIISDTHLPRGSRALPTACLERLVDADLILHGGDFATAEVMRALEELGPPVAAVHGNVDDTHLRLALPSARINRAGKANIALIHDAGPAEGRLERLDAAASPADALVFGHSHAPLHQSADDGFQIFNPGSPTERRRAPHRTMGMGFVDGLSLAFELVTLD